MLILSNIWLVMLDYTRQILISEFTLLYVLSEAACREV